MSMCIYVAPLLSLTVAQCLSICCFVSVYYRDVKYHEPEFWKFGEEGNKYFRHATGQIYAISKDLATYISINQYVYVYSYSLCIFCYIFWGEITISAIVYSIGNQGTFLIENQSFKLHLSLRSMIVLHILLETKYLFLWQVKMFWNMKYQLMHQILIL